MAYTLQDFTFDGTREFDLNFSTGYQSRGDVTCHIRETSTRLQFEWLTDSRVRITTPSIPTGTQIRFERTVSKHRLPFDLRLPEAATREAISACVLHTFRAMQELLDGRFSESLNVDGIVARAVQEAVDSALTNFIFQSSLKWEHNYSGTVDSAYRTLAIGPDHEVMAGQAVIIVDAAPAETSEIRLVQNGSIIATYRVTAAGVVTTLHGTSVLSGDPVQIVSSGGAMTVRAAVPCRHLTTVDFDATSTDYVQIFEDSKNEL